MSDHGAPFDYHPLTEAEADGESGWYSWNLVDRTRYNTAVLGELRVRGEGERCRLRMFPERRHTNLGDNIHGAATLGLIDIALFATMHVIGSGNAGPSVTVELSTQFVGAGDPERPLDAVTEIVRETGRMLFLRGECVQGDDVVTSYSGIVRKMKPRPVGKPE
ncbi:PaaI family thioesterase [Erythrobacter ani]|uniref:PaaI family thioesterase n=1 Tax=Erythrobacter ani TaxID=2827235 RepID=A0ABS6SRE3_9SPHN|nr:PaaI family thioesterase [Erythrobacter ani]MBV7266948.1 PaaI family thioesterase [Erythrobacter ani]